MAGIAIAPSLAYAEKGDSTSPTQVESDRMEYNDLEQVNVFTGNVVLTRGTIRLNANRLVVRQDTDGYQYATATGDPARFRQKRDGPGNQWVQGHAQRIEYDGKADTVRLLHTAMLERTEGSHVIDEVHGSEIFYQARTEFFTVKSDSRDATPGNPRGRVRVVIQPRDEKAQASKKPSAPVPLIPADRIDLPKKKDGPRG